MKSTIVQSQKASAMLVKGLALAGLLLVTWAAAASAVATKVNVAAEAGPPIEGATLLILNPEGEVVAEEESDEEGVVTVDLPAGDYRVTTVDGAFSTEVEAGETKEFKVPIIYGILDDFSPASIGNYLSGLLEQGTTDVTRLDDFTQVWSELKPDQQRAVDGVWRQPPTPPVIDSNAITTAAQDGAQWAADTAVFLDERLLDTAVSDPPSLTQADLEAMRSDIEASARFAREQIAKDKARAKAALERAREQSAGQIRNLEEDIASFREQIWDLERKRDIAKANLDAYRRQETLWESLDLFGDDRGGFLEDEITDAEKRIRVLKAQLAATGEALEAKKAEADRYEQALEARATKADPELLAQEEELRYQEAVELQRELAWKDQQIVAGLKAYEEHIALLDAEIAEARKLGLMDLVAKFEADKIAAKENLDLWLAGLETTRYRLGRELQSAFERNRADGIGPGNGNDLRAEVIARGEDPKVVLEPPNKERTDSSANSARTVLRSRQQEEVYTWNDFYLDMFTEYLRTHSSWEEFSGRYGAYFAGVGRAGKDAVYDLFVLAKGMVEVQLKSWERAINYYFDTELELVDAGSIDTLEGLIRSLGDLDSEEIHKVTQEILGQLERRLERQAGSGEKGLREALGDTGYVVGTLVGVEEAGVKVVAIATRHGTRYFRVYRAADGAVEVVDAGTDAARLADAGTDAGKAAPPEAGALDTTVVEAPPAGVETVPPPGGVETVPPPGGVETVPPPGGVETVPPPGGVETVPPPGGVETVPPPGGVETVPPPGGVETVPPPGGVETVPPPGGVETVPPPGGVETVPPPDGADGSGTFSAEPGDPADHVPSQGTSDEAVTVGDDIATPADRAGQPRGRAPPTDELAVSVTTDGKVVTIERSDGAKIVVGEDGVWAGSFSTTYGVPGRNDIVVKITKPDVAGIAAQKLDDLGYGALQGVDPEVLEVPRVLWQYKIKEGINKGGVVTVLDRAPPSLKSSLRKAGRKDMTPGQAAAYNAGIKELNARGYSWLDNKYDNYSFREIGPPGSDQWRLVIFDPGGIVPLKDLDPGVARALQRAIDNPESLLPLLGPEDQAKLREILSGNWTNEKRLRFKDILARLFDDKVDFDTVNRATGGRYRTLDSARGEGVPYNPMNGRQFPELRKAVAGEEAAEMVADTVIEGPPPLLRRPGPSDAPPMDQPATIVHVPVGVLRDPKAIEPILPWVVRRFVIGAFDPEDPATDGSATGVLVVSNPGDQSAPAVDQLIADANHVEDDAARVEQFEFDDPYLRSSNSWGHGRDDQWAIKHVGFTSETGSAWELAPADGSPVVVAVIDSGVAWSHPDLGPSRLWINDGEIPRNQIDDDGNGYVDDVVGWNFVEGNSLPWDLDGHGTLVAGIIAASSGNGVGIAGVNPTAEVMVLRALDHIGRTRASHVAEAVVYAANNGAQVINLSVGGQGLTRTEEMAIDYAHSRGVVVIAAAGNEAVDMASYGPASAPHVVAVAATDAEDKRLAMSNWGPAVDIAAPGVDVLGLRAPGTDLMAKFPELEYQPEENVVGADGLYYRATGTSFSAPIVAGVASLLLSANASLTPDEVERILLQSARDVEVPGFDSYTGFGVVDARAALTADPAFFIGASISGVAMAQKDGKPVVAVSGSATADRFARAWVELGPGDDPSDWTVASEAITTPVDAGTVGEIPVQHFQGAKRFTLRLVVEHADGRRREARFTLDLG